MQIFKIKNKQNKSATSNRNGLQGQNLFCYFRKSRKHNTLKKNCIKMKVKMNAESCSAYLSFVPKLKCSLKKGIHLFSCSDFLSFVPKLRCSPKK